MYDNLEITHTHTHTHRERERREREREREREIHLFIVHETQSIPSHKIAIEISPAILNMEKNHDDTYWTLCDWKNSNEHFGD